jgi:hypothetical protein
MVSQGESRYGSTTLHEFAAEVELATPEFDGDECPIGHLPSVTPASCEERRPSDPRRARRHRAHFLKRCIQPRSKASSMSHGLRSS